MTDMTITTLSTGLRVGNFSSPHEFKFTDGSVLPACSEERARLLMLEATEYLVPSGCGRYADIGLTFSMSGEVAAALDAAEQTDVDLVLIPFPVMTAMKQAGRDIGKCRVCRVADRVNKTIYHDKFCV